MSKHETPMTRWYWKTIGGTLVEEFPAVNPGPRQGQRLIDGVIILGEEERLATAREVNLEGKDIVVVQSKRGRLGMYLMGQVVFSAFLMKQFRPRSIKSVAVCDQNDDVLSPLLLSFPDTEVAIYTGYER